MKGDLIFKFGTMGSSKTAQALITRFQYEENHRWTDLIKPATDTRDGKTIVKSRIGLQAEAIVFSENDSILEYVHSRKCNAQIIVADEAQFFTPKQIEELRQIADEGRSVICYGLKTNFKTELFAGSKRLIELADRIEEIENICCCGRKATVNARINASGLIVRTGEEVQMGKNDCYEAMCYHCWSTRDFGWKTY